MYVHAGEENGRVALWHITDEIFNSLNIYERFESSRKKSYSGHRPMKDQKFRVRAIVPQIEPSFPQLSEIKPIRVWIAHYAPLASLQYIPSSKALLVASLDGTSSFGLLMYCSYWNYGHRC